MSTSPETAATDPVNATSSSSDGLQRSTSNRNKGANSEHVEKTISCVSCRKRKLKCDRLKPKCNTCTRLRHDCEYPERRRTIGSKRRNMKDLEARLAQVETRLVTETSKNAQLTMSAEADWVNMPLDMNIDFADEAFLGNIGMSDMGSAFNLPPEQVPIVEPLYSQEMVSLGLDEALPPDEMIEELHRIYFDKLHSTMPMVHPQRYFASLANPMHMRPPIYLRYAIWASAATLSDAYSQYDDLFYERARTYLERAEMKGRGETFVTVATAQTWALISTYEAKKTYFTRAWMSTGRMSRLCHMLGLHRIDGERLKVKELLPPAKDWVELEERRRTFWVGFYCDRWASSGTGWPMSIDEDIISTNLPSSEEAYESGNIEAGLSLSEALTPAGAARISPFGGVVLTACLFGHNFQHLQKRGPNERPNDVQNGEFWKRHRRMENILSNTFMFLPDHLRLPTGIRDMNVVFLHMNIHAAAICLQQAATLTAENNGIDPVAIGRSRARSLMAAEEIANIMRLIAHIDASFMNSWLGFCLYTAASVFIQDQASGTKRPESIPNLEFILEAMRAIGNRHTITQHFAVQVEIDIENSGILKKQHTYYSVDMSESLAPDQSDDLFQPKLIADICGNYFGPRPLAGVLPIRNQGRGNRVSNTGMQDPMHPYNFTDPAARKTMSIHGTNPNHALPESISDTNKSWHPSSYGILHCVYENQSRSTTESPSSNSANGHTPQLQTSTIDPQVTETVNSIKPYLFQSLVTPPPSLEDHGPVANCPFTQMMAPQNQ